MTDDAVQALPNGPYGAAARLYWSAGWGNPLPLGKSLPGYLKTPPPDGFTGKAGRAVSWTDLNGWLSGREATQNIAVRATGGYIGIDVDSYDGKWGIETIEKVEAELGSPLPPTFYSTSRGPGGRSGIRFFRVPVGWDASNLERAIRERYGRIRDGRAESDVEIIWYGWRYALVWPSVHPDTGETYRLYGPDHSELPDVPRMDSAPLLPDAWLALGESEAARAPSGDAGDPFGQPTDTKRTAKTPEQAEALFAERLALFEQATSENSHRTDKLRDAALMAGHGVPNFWTAENARARLLLAAEQNGFTAVKGAAYVEFQATKSIRDGYASEQWERVDVFTPPTPSIPRASLRSKILNRAQVREIPPAVPLIDGVLDLNTTAWLIGVKKEYKSFVALDWAAHVATGRAWRGKRVTQGKVLYIAGEGVQGLNKRMDAWEATYGVPIPVDEFTVLPLPVQVAPDNRGQKLGSEWLELIEIAREDRQSFIVVDTQARMTVGLEENSNTEMGIFVYAVEELKRAGGACVLPVHHMGHNGDQARGASGLGGAMDAGWKAQKVGKKAGESDGIRKLKLSCLDMKDADDSESMEIEMIHVELPNEPRGSLALKPFNPFDQPPPRALPSHIENMIDHKKHVIEVMREHSDQDGSAPARIHTWIKERFGYDMPKSTLDSTLRALVEDNKVSKPTRAIYVLNEHLD